MSDDIFSARYEVNRDLCLNNPIQFLEQAVPTKLIKQSERADRVRHMIDLSKKFAGEPRLIFKKTAAELIVIADQLVANSNNSENVKLHEEVRLAMDYVFDGQRMPSKHPLSSIKMVYAGHSLMKENCPYAEKLRAIIAVQLSALEKSCLNVTRNFCDYPTYAGSVIDTYANILCSYLKMDPQSAVWTVFADSYTQGGATLEENNCFDIAQRIDHKLATTLPSSWKLTRLAADNFSRHTDQLIECLITHPRDDHRINWVSTSKCMTEIRKQLEGTYPYFINMFEAADQRFQDAKAHYGGIASAFALMRPYPAAIRQAQPTKLIA